MRTSFLAIVLLGLSATLLFSADVRDLGVPAGWRASDYDRRGYDLLNKHDYENARRYFDAAIRTDPYFWGAYYNRAVTFGEQKKWTAALQDLNSTIHLKPNFLQASLMRAHVNQQLGDYKAALRDFDIVAPLTLQVMNYSEYCQTLNNRAWIRATCPDDSIRNGQLAIADARKACELNRWKLSFEIDTLAAAYAEVGDFDSAIRYEEQAITRRRALPQEASKMLAKLRYDQELHKRLTGKVAQDVEKSLAEMTKRLELYKQHRAFRDTASR